MTKSLLPARWIRSAGSKVGCLGECPLDAGAFEFGWWPKRRTLKVAPPVMMHDRDVS